MAGAVNAQNAVTADASRNVAKINELAERTANNAQQASGMSDELVTLASELEKLVNSFTL
jgi:methyl-accepting chemotaxis protein